MNRAIFRKRLALASLTASALTLSAGAAFADYTLNILHMNDWHSRIEPINKYDSTCSPEDDAEGECFGGAARLVTAVAESRAALEGENVLLLNAGDNFQGSLFYTTYKGAAEAEFLNLMKTDAMVVGNHEFDDGEDGLAAFLDKVEFPVLGSNIKAKEASALGDRVKEYLLLDVGGEKIAIVGAVANDTAELSSPGENVSIIEDVAGITAAVEAVTAEGANKVIALTHVGYPRDLEAIARIPGVDVVVGGHSNTLLSNTVEGAQGPYPTMVDNPDGHQVPVVQAASYSKYLGELKLTFNDDGAVTAATGDVKLIDASVAKDEAVVTRVKELAGPIEALKNKIVAETTAAVDGSRETCRAGECEMGNLVTDAMVARSSDQGVQFAITNGGGLRASIDGGEVTMGEVLGVLPFQNTLATFQISGADVVASLESGVSQLEDGAGRFPQVSGLRYSFDPSVAPGEGRIKSVEVKDGDGWAAIDPEATYTVASNNFMRNGGDGYKLFAENSENAYDYGPGLEQVLADYLAENSPYTPAIDGRITKVAAGVAGSDDETSTPEPSKTMVNKAPSAVGNAVEKTGEAIKSMTDSAKEMAGKAAEEAGNAMNKMSESAEDTAKDAGEAVKNMAGEASDAMEKAAEATGNAMEETAKDAETMSEDAADTMSEAGQAAETAMSGEKKTHTVARGDTLWEIARSHYGDPTKWSAIAEANPQIDPDRIDVGMELTLPSAN